MTVNARSARFFSFRNSPALTAFVVLIWAGGSCTPATQTVCAAPAIGSDALQPMPTSQQEPRLIAAPSSINRAVRAALNDGQGRALYAAMLARFDTSVEVLRKAHQVTPPNFSFEARSYLTDLVVTYELARRVSEANREAGPTPERLGAMREAAIAATLDLVEALRRGGDSSARYSVGQGSNTMALAVAYDWLYDALTPEQRQIIAGAMIDYSIRPTVQVYLRGETQWWVTGMNNWSFINGGSALMSLLALRPSEIPDTLTTSVKGQEVTQPYSQVFDELTQTVLTNLSRGFRLVEANNGLWGEGPGYQHDTVFPWYLLVASLETSVQRGQLDTPATTTGALKFIADAKRTAALLVYSSIYLRGPMGRDWEYSDGNWNFSAQSVNFLLADYAHQQNSPLWRMAAWQTLASASQDTPGLSLLYGAAFDWGQPVSTPLGMKGFAPTNDIPLGHVFFKRLVNTDSEVGVNEFLVTWRQNWDAPSSAGVMFKGSDRRVDMHSHLDAGTFLYESQGVRWAVEVPRPNGYPLFVPAENPGGRYSSYQAFPKRAEAHSTLVINPQRNDYLAKKVVKDWMAPVNPDQAQNDGTSFPVNPVEDIHMEPGSRVWSGAVNDSNAYARHGLRSRAQGAPTDSRRVFEFNRRSGELTVRDELQFVQGDNEVFWFLATDGKTQVVFNNGKKLLLGARRADKTPVYLELLLDQAPGNTNGGWKFGRIDENRPGGPPEDKWLWGYSNAEQQKRDYRKVALHLTGIGTSATIVVHLKPRPDLVGQDPATLVQKLKAAASI